MADLPLEDRRRCCASPGRCRAHRPPLPRCWASGERAPGDLLAGGAQTVVVQKAHRVAATGIVLLHSGQSFVLGSSFE